MEPIPERTNPSLDNPLSRLNDIICQVYDINEENLSDIVSKTTDENIIEITARTVE